MRRRLLHLVSALSLLLAIATAVLWPISYFRAILWAGYSDRAGGRDIDREWSLGSIRGRMIWQMTTYGSPDGSGWAGHWRGIAPVDRMVTSPHEPPRRGLAMGGFYFDSRTVTCGAAIDRHIHIPHWFLLGVFLLLSARWWLTRRTATAVNVCSTCGYDLRATPLRCPECGTPAAEMSAAT